MKLIPIDVAAFNNILFFIVFIDEFTFKFSFNILFQYYLLYMKSSIFYNKTF